MCGRFVQATPPSVLAQRFGVDEVRAADLEPRWNVAPTDRVWAVAEHRGRRLLGTFRWGLVPSWVPDAKSGARMINARAETAAEKPAFREALARRRCLVPADGFYEWRRTADGARRPVHIRSVDGAPLAFAGLWEAWRAPGDDAPLRTCTILTTTANGAVARVHDRMPVVLDQGTWDVWLDPDERDVAGLQTLLRPAADELLTVRPVGMRVNDVRNDGADLLEPAGA